MKSANVASDSAASFGTDSIDHGTSVASIIGARGNNSVGMAGVMWNASLWLSDYIARPASPVGVAYNPYEALNDLVQAGVPIINYSSGYTWLQIKHRLPQATSADSSIVRAIGETMYMVVSGFNAENTLFVIAAGNDGIDAWWSGVTQVADSADVSDHVLVVAGTNQMLQLFNLGTGQGGSNYNVQHSLVGIAAPGQDVGALDSTSSAHVVLVTGTSFAAPYVTGVAGLLRSFDSRLTPAEIKDLIIAGAQRGGRTAGGIPFLNAHQSMLAAARRSGAPLCGNRVWVQNSSLKTERGDSLNPTIETIGSIDDDEAFGVVGVEHGGRKIGLCYFAFVGTGFEPACDEYFTYANNEWVATGASNRPTYTPQSGAVRSALLMSHDGDSSLVLEDDPILGEQRQHVIVSVGSSTSEVATVQFRSAPDTALDVDYLIQAAYSPMGDMAIVTGTLFYRMSFSVPYTESSEVWRVPLTGSGAPSKLWEMPNYSVGATLISEDGKQLVMEAWQGQQCISQYWSITSHMLQRSYPIDADLCGGLAPPGIAPMKVGYGAGLSSGLYRKEHR